MSLNVCWSDSLDAMADGLWRVWAEAGDPVSRLCVVVGDLATRDWLKSRFLALGANSRRRVLAGVDFKPLAEFVNDWLAATLHPSQPRRATEHPYSKNVLAWRIYSILCHADPSGPFAPLVAYVAAGGTAAARRRFSLAVRLAQLYDDYLSSRHPLLLRWERGLTAGCGAPPWQGALYAALAAQCPETYARDYEAALNPATDPSLAFVGGFPRYSSVHVFDVAFAPWPCLEFLRRISEALPVAFWTFNPSPREYWLEAGSRRDAARHLVAETRAALLAGEQPPVPESFPVDASPDDAFLAALASGARGVLGAELEFAAYDPVIAGRADALATLRRLPVECHVCHSPRRELEALADALKRFFSECPDARACDALVLCAAPSDYAPLVSGIFGVPGDEGYIPVALEGALLGESQMVRTFESLLDFADNRFAANDVFALLAVPAVSRRFDLDSDAVATLRDMAREANARWGYDDDDVRSTLGIPPEADTAAPRPFTWRRALDRLFLNALMGEVDGGGALVDAGAIGRLAPCGNVEGERIAALTRLDAFVRRLASFRRDLAHPRSCAQWRDVLLAAIDDFISPSDDELAEVEQLRLAVDGAAVDAMRAAECVGEASPPVEAAVFAAAALGHVRGHARRGGAVVDAVRFAPLKNASATPARFVWVCGLSDGDFPRDGSRPAFDLIGRHPSLFDATARERDSYALLKAALGARERLAFSYVGRDARTNDPLPPSPPLAELMDWLGPGRIVRYEHPLQPFSPEYFMPDGVRPRALPPSYSRSDRAAAEAVLRAASPDPASAQGEALTAFSLEDAAADGLDMADVAEFLSHPNAYLLRRRLGARVDNPLWDELAGDEALDAEVPFRQRSALKRGGEAALSPEEMVERGVAPSAVAALDMIAEVISSDDADKLRRRTLRFKSSPPGYSCDGIGALEALALAAEATPVAIEASCPFDGRTVCARGFIALVSLAGLDHSVRYCETKPRGGELAPEEAEAIAWHVAGHASGRSFASVVVYGDGSLKALWPMPRAEAERKWCDILALAFDALPSGLPDIAVSRKNDRLPPEMAARLADGMDFVSSRRLA